MKQKITEIIMKAGERARDLTEQILAFSRQAEQERKPVQISLIIKESLKLLQAGLPDNIDIKQNINTNCGTIFADPTLIHQLIMNLCINAYHSMREKGGVLEVNLQNTDFESRDSLIDLVPGPYLQLTVNNAADAGASRLHRHGADQRHGGAGGFPGTPGQV
jgi:nitrogen-specific signal transduction histidine kinase